MKEIVDDADFVGSGKQVAKSFARGTLEFTKGAGSMLQVLADNLADAKKSERMGDGWFDMSSGLSKVADLLKRYSQAGIDSDLLKLDGRNFFRNIC